ncbi:MAG: hypothetical protein JW947_06605 [Sedimentisphaerales bacterium]|nr:hypothetical protein [Sedimentisphaerales bacterium]
MDEKQAEMVAAALGGEALQSGGGIWLVILRQGNGKLVVISDEAICEYEDEQHFEQSKPAKAIFLRQNSASLN